MAGYWKQKKGDGVVVNYHPRHTYNVDEMVEALEGARRWYGEWFAPFPWRELRLTEFAAMATYAQGSPGNITFSEGIGFLSKSEPKANAAFWITAHEAAHQWWPNIAMTGDGPGGDVLSEGRSHFSTILLIEQVKGLEQRMAFCKQIEDGYGNIRRRDAERPMVKVNGELPGDRRIIYDKGGWVLWMLFQQMGREAGLAAQRDYLETYRDSRDHPRTAGLSRGHAPARRRHHRLRRVREAVVLRGGGAAVPAERRTDREDCERLGRVDAYKIPILVSLCVIVVLLAGSVAMSLLRPQAKPPLLVTPPPSDGDTAPLGVAQPVSSKDVL